MPTNVGSEDWREGVRKGEFVSHLFTRVFTSISRRPQFCSQALLYVLLLAQPWRSELERLALG